MYAVLCSFSSKWKIFISEEMLILERIQSVSLRFRIRKPGISLGDELNEVFNIDSVEQTFKGKIYF